ncbi:MAG TPA: hypothetical protein VK550_19395 [Polyangiaceae bacterium]|nr:hypothetical protein [Polyangiaceae bacterium]
MGQDSLSGSDSWDASGYPDGAADSDGPGVDLPQESGQGGAAGAGGGGTAGGGGAVDAGSAGHGGAGSGAGGAADAATDDVGGVASDAGDGANSADGRDAAADTADSDADACSPPPTGCGPCPLCGLVPKCSEVSATTITGKVFTARATGADSVPRAVVYIPNIALGAKLGTLPSGPRCDRCEPLTQTLALSSATTGPDGSFQLQGNIPAGVGIPLVVQLGKWRYETTVDVQPCAHNAIADGVARLPRTQAEGNIPLTAISTGDVDALECILRKMGVADSEFSNPTGSGRIHFFRNNGARYDATTPSQAALVEAPAIWDRYDQVLFPCEGMQSNETPSALTNFIDYTDKGGRVFATHFSYTWLYQNGGFATAGTWQVNQSAPPSPLVSTVDTTTQKGRDFAIWLDGARALSNANPPQVSIYDPRASLAAVPPMMGGERWIYSESQPTVQYMSVATPVNAPPFSQCGRVVFSDFHVANATNQNITFPAQCPTSDLTPQEKILEFILLDLAACF